MNTEDSEFERIEREQAMKGVPDAIHHTDTSETLEYITGWNDCRQAMLMEQPAQQKPAGWRPATFHRDNLTFNPGLPDEQTVKFWKLQGVEIEYCYTSPLMLSPGAALYTTPQSQENQS